MTGDPRSAFEKLMRGRSSSKGGPSEGVSARARVVVAMGLLLGSCDSAPEPGERLERQGDEIVVAGQLFHTGTPVVLWNDPGGYDAYRAHRHFEPDIVGPSQNPKRVARFGSRRGSLPEDVAARVEERGWSLEDLAKVVSQVVVHFDACGTSKRCFQVLHDVRGLSCHFLLDLDGTIYQTLDLKERAWHAAQANDRSIGIEIANIGAYASYEPLSAWYVREGETTRLVIPADSRGNLPADSVLHPRRAGPVRGVVQGQTLVQYDYTEEQYRALECLLTALARIFPRVRARVPLGEGGDVLDRSFASDEELHAFEGILGHYHVTTRKVDPGPAFDWERILRTLREAGLE